jgi:hypothetical protein
MCIICDRASEDEVLFDMFGKIEKYGFTMAMVESTPPWTYTIGLAAQLHPELVVTGLPAEQSVHFINHVVDRIDHGMRFDEHSPPLDIHGNVVRFGRVHTEQWHHGRLDRWLRYYDALGDSCWLPREAVQVLWPDKQGRYPPDPEFCCGAGTCQPLLDLAPTSNVNGGPNRAARRRRRRRRH